MKCAGFGSETYIYPRKTSVGKTLKVRCRDCHKAIDAKVTKVNGSAVTVTIPKHERGLPWHKR